MNRRWTAGALSIYAHANHLVLDGLAQLSEAEFTRAPIQPRFDPWIGPPLLECEAWFSGALQGRTLQALTCPRSTTCAAFSANSKGTTCTHPTLAESDRRRDLEVQFEQHPSISGWQLLVQAFVTRRIIAQISILSANGHPLPTLDIILHFCS